TSHVHYHLSPVTLPSPLTVSFLLTPPPHKPTLFPYTTLFRSEMLDYHVAKTRLQPGLSSKKAWLPPTPGLRDWQTQMAERDVERSEETRLNSSHQIISYAVFCLKKKKNTEN